MNDAWDDVPVLFTFNNVPLKVKPLFWIMWLSGWPLLSWIAKKRDPNRSWFVSFLIGAASMPFTFIADIGHAMAHTISAEAAFAPMDEIQLASDMPRTIYFNNDVTPDQHRIRAIGGPIYSFIGLTLSLLWRKLSKSDTAVGHIAEVSAVSQAFIFFGSLMPLKQVDGGTLLKWTLVDQGRSEEEADQIVTKASIGAVIGLAVTAVLWGVKFFAGRK